jgi:maltose alpha-D-glucosyltransferase/alpha-amylase
MRGFLSWRRGDAALLAEANVPMDEVDEYVGTGNKLHMLFAFLMNQHLWLAIAAQRAAPIIDALGQLATLPPTCQWVNFLRNHDELDLGRLTEAERQLVYDAFAPTAAMRLYERGIRRRLSPMLGDRARRELAHSLMLGLSGTPVLYYGDEIGMGDDLTLPERECVRTPMQWSPGIAGGFSHAPAERLVRPVVRDGAFGCDSVNVVNQQRDPSSFLNWLQRAIGVRKTCRELSWGQSEVVASGNDAVCALQCRWQGVTLLTVYNLGADACTVRLDGVTAPAGVEPVEVLSDREYDRWAGPQDTMPLDGFGYRWLRFVSAP